VFEPTHSYSSNNLTTLLYSIVPEFVKWRGAVFSQNYLNVLDMLQFMYAN